MTKKKTTPIKDTKAAKDNRTTNESITANIAPLLAPRPVPHELFFDELGFTPEQLIKRLEDLGWWGYLEKGEIGEKRGIEVRLTN